MKNSIFSYLNTLKDAMCSWHQFPEHCLGSDSGLVVFFLYRLVYITERWSALASLCINHSNLTGLYVMVKQDKAYKGLRTAWLQMKSW